MVACKVANIIKLPDNCGLNLLITIALLVLPYFVAASESGQVSHVELQLADSTNKDGYVFKRAERSLVKMWYGKTLEEPGSNIIDLETLLDHEAMPGLYHEITIKGFIPPDSSYFVIEIREPNGQLMRTSLIVSVRFTYDGKKQIMLNQFADRPDATNLDADHVKYVPNYFRTGNNIVLTILLDYDQGLYRILDEGVEISQYKTESVYFKSLGLKKKMGIYDGVYVNTVTLYELRNVVQEAMPTSLFVAKRNMLCSFLNHNDRNRQLITYHVIDIWDTELSETRWLSKGLMKNFGIQVTITPTATKNNKFTIELINAHGRTVFLVSVNFNQKYMDFNEHDENRNFMSAIQKDISAQFYANTAAEISIIRREQSFIVYCNRVQIIIYYQRREESEEAYIKASFKTVLQDVTISEITYAYFEEHENLTPSEVQEYLVSQEHEGFGGRGLFREITPFGLAIYKRQWRSLNSLVASKTSDVFILMHGLDVSNGLILTGELYGDVIIHLIEEKWLMELTIVKSKNVLQYKDMNFDLPLDSNKKQYFQIYILRIQDCCFQIIIDNQVVANIIIDHPTRFLYSVTVKSSVRIHHPEYIRFKDIHETNTRAIYRVQLENGAHAYKYIQAMHQLTLNVTNPQDLQKLKLENLLEPGLLIVVQGQFQKPQDQHMLIRLQIGNIVSFELKIFVNADNDQIISWNRHTCDANAHRPQFDSSLEVQKVNLFDIGKNFMITILVEESGFRIFNDKNQIHFMTSSSKCHSVKGANNIAYLAVTNTTAVHYATVSYLSEGLRPLPLDLVANKRRYSAFLLDSLEHPDTLHRISGIVTDSLAVTSGTKSYKLSNGFSDGSGLEIKGYFPKHSQMLNITLTSAHHKVFFRILIELGDHATTSFNANFTKRAPWMKVGNPFALDREFHITIVNERALFRVYDRHICIASISFLDDDYFYKARLFINDDVDISQIDYVEVFESIRIARSDIEYKIKPESAIDSIFYDNYGIGTRPLKKLVTYNKNWTKDHLKSFKLPLFQENFNNGGGIQLNDVNNAVGTFIDIMDSFTGNAVFKIMISPNQVFNTKRQLIGMVYLDNAQKLFISDVSTNHTDFMTYVRTTGDNSIGTVVKLPPWDIVNTMQLPNQFLTDHFITIRGRWSLKHHFSNADRLFQAFIYNKEQKYLLYICFVDGAQKCKNEFNVDFMTPLPIFVLGILQRKNVFQIYLNDALVHGEQVGPELQMTGFRISTYGCDVQQMRNGKLSSPIIENFIIHDDGLENNFTADIKTYESTLIQKLSQPEESFDLGEAFMDGYLLVVRGTLKHQAKYLNVEIKTIQTNKPIFKATVIYMDPKTKEVSVDNFQKGVFHSRNAMSSINLNDTNVNMIIFRSGKKFAAYLTGDTKVIWGNMDEYDISNLITFVRVQGDIEVDAIEFYHINGPPSKNIEHDNKISIERNSCVKTTDAQKIYQIVFPNALLKIPLEVLASKGVDELEIQLTDTDSMETFLYMQFKKTWDQKMQMLAINKVNNESCKRRTDPNEADCGIKSYKKAYSITEHNYSIPPIKIKLAADKKYKVFMGNIQFILPFKAREDFNNLYIMNKAKICWPEAESAGEGSTSISDIDEQYETQGERPFTSTADIDGTSFQSIMFFDHNVCS